ncbi:MAG: hypothetical protein JWM12_64 [Ilumatobacteraceae bacterium]|nr:hypothetical protein [Ilumatobacteraceae bacterium]
MLLVVVFVGVVVGLVRPRPSRFGRPRAVAVVFAAAFAQVLSTATHAALHGVLLVASLSLGVVWVGLQRRHLATLLLGIGVALNVAVIAANNGMPVDAGALETVGRRNADVTDGFLYKHVPMNGSTRLTWLGDRIPVPIQRNVISVGDVLMAVAIGLWVADNVGSWWMGRRSAGPVHGEHGRGPGREVVGGGD